MVSPPSSARDAAMTRTNIARAAAVVLGLVAGTGPALAHPHVWVRTRAEIVLDGGRLAALRQSWTFDPDYSAFAVINLDSKRDGVPDPDRLAAMARERIEAMAETAFFTAVKLNGRPVAFGPASEPRAEYRDGRLTLHFTLTPQAPTAAVRALVLGNDDPDFYVSFAMAPGPEAVRLAGAPACVLKVSRPAKDAQEGEQLIPDEVATSRPGAASATAADYAGRVLVACP
ncbi:DUF1007 family protein [Methylobacterium oryzihabitans]|uniref:DUF1007 family protein n=2 Tax=Methylobacterium oryzihabitans TaxID=2499852 RepID=A0A3S2VM02_9HYPH|nr:DUF1007 family protein [Methylobacterium oryzihabitans]